jgi:LysE type translocator.
VSDQQEPRPLIERLGLAAIALVVTVLFGTIGVAALASNEWFLGVMGLIGALMTLWAGIGSLRRG